MATPIVAFNHGVASGDPYSDSVILWTRVTPADLQTSSLDVSWEASRSASFDSQSIVDSGIFRTDSNRDWTVKVEAAGLNPDTTYYYRFRVGEQTSETGETKTLPFGINPVRLAVLSCANFTNTPIFEAYGRVAQVNQSRPYDAALVLGDYIYEYGKGGYAAAESAVEQRGFSPDREIIILDDYRLRYAQYHTDSGLQAMRAALPLIAIWDDHETANNSWSGGAQNHQPATEGDWIARRDAALQAYYEWMPIREPILREGADQGDATTPLTQGYRSFNFGDVLALHMLETRLIARDEQLSYPGEAEVVTRINEILASRQLLAGYAAALGTTVDPGDPSAVAAFANSAALTRLVTFQLVAATVTQAWSDPSRDMIGAQQLAWLTNAMASSQASWQVLGQQVLMQSMAIPAELLLNAGDPAVLAKYSAPLFKLATGVQLTAEELALFDEANKVPYNLDAWDGYGVARETILQTAAALGKSLVSLAGDTHNAWAGVLDVMSTTAAAKAGDVVGLEFATPGVSSPGLESLFGPGLEPLFTSYVDGLKYADLSQRGFLDITFTNDEVVASFQFISGVNPQTGATVWTSDNLLASSDKLILPLTPELFGADSSSSIGELQGVDKDYLLNFSELSAFGLQEIDATAEASRSADYSSTVGFYKVLNASGDVRDPMTGRIIRPGEVGYAAAATDASNRAALGELSRADGQISSEALLFTQLDGLVGLYGFVETTNQTFFSFASANADGYNHFKFLGPNKVGFEDLFNGGDKDHNDLIVDLNFG